MQNERIDFQDSTLSLAPPWMANALAGFEMDCKMACRGMKVLMAVKVFGVGTLLPNDLSDRPGKPFAE